MFSFIFQSKTLTDHRVLGMLQSSVTGVLLSAILHHRAHVNILLWTCVEWWWRPFVWESPSLPIANYSQARFKPLARQKQVSAGRNPTLCLTVQFVLQCCQWRWNQCTAHGQRVAWQRCGWLHPAELQVWLHSLHNFDTVMPSKHTLNWNQGVCAGMFYLLHWLVSMYHVSVCA